MNVTDDDWSLVEFSSLRFSAFLLQVFDFFQYGFEIVILIIEHLS
jgi:hypothetical protein